MSGIDGGMGIGPMGDLPPPSKASKAKPLEAPSIATKMESSAPLSADQRQDLADLHEEFPHSLPESTDYALLTTSLSRKGHVDASTEVSTGMAAGKDLTRVHAGILKAVGERLGR